MIDSRDLLARSDRFLGPAEAALRAKLAAAPERTALRWRLAEVLRQRGALAEAAAAARAVAAADDAPEAAAAVLAALEGRPLPSDEGLRPAPFALHDALLSEGEKADLWEVIRTHAGRFAEAAVTRPDGGAAYRPEQRRTEILDGAAFPALAATLRERVPALAAAAWAARGLPAAVPRRVDVFLSAHVDGGFFTVHQDNSVADHTTSRAVTFVYYLHRTPRPFSGGDLLLLDSDPEAGTFGRSYTRITPDDGRLVLFPSGFFHQVTPVASTTGRFEDARFAVVGWIHDAPPAG